MVQNISEQFSANKNGGNKIHTLFFLGCTAINLNKGSEINRFEITLNCRRRSIQSSANCRANRFG